MNCLLRMWTNTAGMENIIPYFVTSTSIVQLGKGLQNYPFNVVPFYCLLLAKSSVFCLFGKFLWTLCSGDRGTGSLVYLPEEKIFSCSEGLCKKTQKMAGDWGGVLWNEKQNSQVESREAIRQIIVFRIVRFLW